jgi:SPP1 family predicted phage head-tail adaptor
MALRNLCNPGALIHRAQFYKPSGSRSTATGEPLREFTATFSCWAAFETVSSRESITNSRQDFSYSHRIVIRGTKTRGALPPLAANHRVAIGGRTLEVTSVTPLDAGHWIEILASESA